jgi:hypothetical protein
MVWMEPRGCGWPWICASWNVTQSYHEAEWSPTKQPAAWNRGAIAGNLVICLALLAVAAVAIEWVTRRLRPRRGNRV